MAGGLLVSGVLASLWRGAGGGEDTLGEYALLQVGLWLALVGVTVAAARWKGSGSVATDFGLLARWRDLGFGVAAGVLSQALLLFVALLLRPFVGKPEVEGPVRDLIAKADGAGYFLLVLFTVVGAPVVEELFFRGLLLRALQKRLGAGWAVALSSMIFGFSHQPDLPADALVVVMVSLTVFGAVLAWLAVRTGRLGAAIVAHATFNALTLSYLTVKP